MPPESKNCFQGQSIAHFSKLYYGSRFVFKNVTLNKHWCTTGRTKKKNRNYTKKIFTTYPISEFYAKERKIGMSKKTSFFNFLERVLKLVKVIML